MFKGSSPHFLCLCCYLVAKSCLFLIPWTIAPPDSSVHGITQGKNTGVGCHFLLQGIILIQESNPHLLQRQMDSLPLCYLGSPSVSKVVLHWRYREATCSPALNGLDKGPARWSQVLWDPSDKDWGWKAGNITLSLEASHITQFTQNLSHEYYSWNCFTHLGAGKGFEAYIGSAVHWTSEERETYDQKYFFNLCY